MNILISGTPFCALPFAVFCCGFGLKVLVDFEPCLAERLLCSFCFAQIRKCVHASGKRILMLADSKTLFFRF